MGPDNWRGDGIVDVKLTQRFGISKYQLTQECYSAWDNLESASKRNLPATEISWFDCYFFLVGLRDERVKLPDGRDYSFTFPFEAQWEYACRAGSSKDYCYGNHVKELSQYAWYDKNLQKSYGFHPHPVGRKLKNAWDLYDMHGNVWEWCWDFVAEYPNSRPLRYTLEYPEEPVIDPVGPTEGLDRVVRGGCYSSSADLCRSAFRYGEFPSDRMWNIGFRLALSSSGIPKSPEAEQEEADDSLGN
jgi:formylglycine-generating enzyme required for sulfatase activity